MKTPEDTVCKDTKPQINLDGICLSHQLIEEMGKNHEFIGFSQDGISIYLSRAKSLASILAERVDGIENQDMAYVIESELIFAETMYNQAIRHINKLEAEIKSLKGQPQ